MGADPDAGSARRQKRNRELWDTFEKVIGICRREKTDLLLIAGDLFHRQPLLRELKEVNAMFASLDATRVVLIAGNHDYIRRDSYYRTFSWSGNVAFLGEEQLSKVEYPELSLAVYGLSYHSREIREALYEETEPSDRQRYRILLAHGGDEEHIPIHKKELLSMGYDYIALGHIHKPGAPDARMIYAGALEPIDSGDTGPHGYVEGELSENGLKTRFVPAATREYRKLQIPVTEETTGYALSEKIRSAIEAEGVEDIYRIRVTGQRDPDIRFDLRAMDPFGNIVELTDETRPAYDFERLMAQNKGNFLGDYIRSFQGAKKDSLEYQALCDGVQALLETGNQ